MEQIQGKVTTAVNEQGVCFLTFSSPPHNALPGHLLQELAAAIEKAGMDREVKVIILGSGGDRTFCAGASFEELKAVSNQEEGYRFFSGFAKVINACRKCPKLIIGRVQGKAVGGGVGIAAATDYCFATQHAAVRLSELALGIGPFVIGPAVERRIGPAAFSHLALRPTEWKSAEWAAEKDFMQKYFPTTQQWMKP
jgi:methylglutaconyl-CoA hydratase